MKRVFAGVVLSVSISAPGVAQPPAPERIAQAYEQFLLAHYLDGNDQVDEAIGAYKRAMELDPTAATIPAELATLYMQQNRASEAIEAAEQALKIDSRNYEAHRVLGLVWGAIAQMGRESSMRPVPGEAPNDSLAQAVDHLEQAVANAVGEADPNTRATLARLYVRAGSYDKAIPLLTNLVDQEPGWNDGPLLLAEAFSGAGRNADAIKWLEQSVPGDPRLLPTLAEFYEREHRWRDAAKTYATAVERAPRNFDLKTRYASALLQTGNRADVEKARDLLTAALSPRPADPSSAQHALYLLSQAQRRLGDISGAEATARKVIAENDKSPWGYYALAEAFEERRQYQAVVDSLAPVVQDFRDARGRSNRFELTLLLPHLGFAYRELQQYDKAIAAFDEAHRLAPNDPNVTAYLIDAHIAAKKYSEAIVLAREARGDRPGTLRIARLEARALHLADKDDEAIALLQSFVKTRADDPAAYVALAQLYSDINRGG